MQCLVEPKRRSELLHGVCWDKCKEMTGISWILTLKAQWTSPLTLALPWSVVDLPSMYKNEDSRPGHSFREQKQQYT